MAFLSFRLILFLAIQCYTHAAQPTSSGAGNNFLTITSSLDTVRTGLTKELTIACSIPDPITAGYTKLVSLVISRKDRVTQTLEEIASVSGFAPDVVNTIGTTTANPSALLNDTGASNLRLDWQYPREEDTGYYECEATVLNPSGHPVKLQSGREVYSADPTLQALVDRFRLMEIEMDSLKDRIAQTSDALFNSTGVYNGSRYLFSQYLVHDVHKAEAACNLAGGYLVEIDDKSEYDLIVQLVNSNKYMETKPGQIYIGITDKNLEGTWEYLHSPKPVTFFKWAPAEPNTADYDCAALYKALSYQYVDFPCQSAAGLPFVCEKNEH